MKLPLVLHLALSCLFVLPILIGGTARAQSTADPQRPVLVEAESGELGDDFAVMEEDGVRFISPQSNLLAAGNPGAAGRVASYEVMFPEAGSYDLFIRVRVGPQTFGDDSFFYGDGFGDKSSTNDSDWRIANGTHDAGFAQPDEFVIEGGNAPAGVWKWLNISQSSFGDAGISFTVPQGALTQTFEIGGREDGLDIDRIAFGRSDLFFTVSNLDNGEAGTTEPPYQEPDDIPMAHGLSKFLGNIYSTSQAVDFAVNWNQVTPENAGKWGSVEATRDVMNWSALDAAYNLAKNNDFPFRFHVLVWGNQQPSWMESLPIEAQLAEIEEWFQAVATRYPDIDFLEVVNEPLHDPPTPGNGGYFQALGGAGETGWDWVLNAFRMARDIFPVETRLMINEYNILSSDVNTERYLEIIQLLQGEDLIDGIGVQGHAFSTRGSATAMTSRLDWLAETGLPVQVTEMDVDGPTDEQQLADYQRIFPALWEHPGVEGITLWGWRPGMWRTEEGAYLVRADGTERPAFEWLRSYMAAQRVSAERPDELPSSIVAFSNYPNPFSSTTDIVYEIATSAHVTLTVFDMMGRRLATPVDGLQAAGRHAISFAPEGLASGVYLYQLTVGSEGSARLMTIVR